MSALMRGGRIQWFPVFPVNQIVRNTQPHAALAHGFALFLGCQQHPPALFLLVPDDMGIPPVAHEIDIAIGGKGILRMLCPVYQIRAGGMPHLLPRIGIAGKLAIEQMIQPVRLHNGAGSAMNGSAVLAFKVQVVPGGYTAPPLIQEKQFEFPVLIKGDDIAHSSFRGCVENVRLFHFDPPV